MKKYKTWEIIKMLQENPSLKFITRARDSSECDLTVFLKHGTLRTSFHTDAFMAAHLLEWEWELVQEPVPFMEAVKAYSEGKTIRCESDCGSWQYKKESGTGHMWKKNNYDSIITSTEILEGTWYVEDSHE